MLAWGRFSSAGRRVRAGLTHTTSPRRSPLQPSEKPRLNDVRITTVEDQPPRSPISSARSEDWDGAVSGFGARRQDGEVISYIVVYRTREGRQRTYTIGKHGSPWSPDTARQEPGGSWARSPGVLIRGRQDRRPQYDHRGRAMPPVSHQCRSRSAADPAQDRKEGDTLISDRAGSFVTSFRYSGGCQ